MSRYAPTSLRTRLRVIWWVLRCKPVVYGTNIRSTEDGNWQIRATDPTCGGLLVTGCWLDETNQSPSSLIFGDVVDEVQA